VNPVVRAQSLADESGVRGEYPAPSTRDILARGENSSLFNAVKVGCRLITPCPFKKFKYSDPQRNTAEKS
jgi:hypothetical protein